MVFSERISISKILITAIAAYIFYAIFYGMGALIMRKHDSCGNWNSISIIQVVGTHSSL